MARVYSWEISEKPKKYAYIVHPQDNTIPYIGNTELSGTNLEKVKNWASTCTDDEYEAQFKILVEKCEEKGVKFEAVTAYTGIESSCDNLRGPAGRGIDYISLSDTDAVRNINTYKIHYTDGTSYTFEIQNGKDGHDGIDGSPGAKGDSGISSKFVMIYTSGKDAYGNNFTPPRPEGGSYDFSKNKITYPTGWVANDSAIEPPVWMSSRTFSTSEYHTDNEWSLPIQITGEAGTPGKDGVSVEFIYYLGDNKPNVDSLESPNEPGYVPPIESGWKTSPTGVDENNLTEWCSIRKHNNKENKWGPWENAVIWSKYGINGQDGDGIQYIYLKNRGELPENPTPNDFIINDSYQNGGAEWIPEPGSQYVNKYGKIVKFAPIEVLPEGSTATPAGVWTDNPMDITAEFHSQWVATRKYRKNDNGDMVWEAYSNPTLWSKFGQDGKNATSVRKIYAISTSTSNPPDLPADSTITGDWSVGFPTDYIAGENVVWGAEAEIWANNFDFVKSYKLVSEKDADGNIIPPLDSNDGNVIDVAEIPTEEIKGYKYIRFNGEYYEWTGGWCKPYLVTGLKGEKGENGNPVDYTTYVFAYGYHDYQPSAPTGNSIKHPGSSTDTNGNEVIWLDFPDTTGGKIDGVVNQNNGLKMRWYQCVGFVNGENGEVKEWGHVYPCNGQDGQDGQALPGRYTEFRFCVTKSNTKPELIEYDNLGNAYREPSLYDDNGTKVGWFATDEELPEIPAGGAMWQIWALIDGSDNSVIINNNKAWNGPIRISGERGEQGIQGPIGMRGVSGIPGSKSLNMYCLGTYGKNSTSKSYWETGGINGGDGYFGSKNWESGVTPDQMTDWYLSTEMPYSDTIEVTTEEELNFESGKTENKGRVIKFIDTSKVEDGTSIFETVTHTYFLVKHDNTIKQLTEPLSLAESEDFNIYVWCIQGNEVWKAGVHAKYINVTTYGNNGDVLPPEDAEDNTDYLDNIPTYKQNKKYIFCDNKYYEWKEIESDDVQHILEKIEWGSPFKLQGTNGLRGLTGSRGQVVYPMGIYNHEEVYITTEDKAPYVYDPNDGMFYVYNVVGEPWVGRLPGYDPETKINDGTYKTILKHPDDAEGNFKVVDENPETNQTEQDTEFKYLYYDNKYYSWNGKQYVVASKYKYSIDGSGNEGTWMTDQQGDTPASNYINATNDNYKPAWVKFESFQALYTSIGIIENGMIGSAVYNNEFMFSQQGYAQDGITQTNYAVISGKDTSYGFLSGYEYDERGEYKNGVPTGRHWKYKGTDNFIDNIAVNPYEQDANEKYIHTFLPNVCINFSTGQMWLSTGKIRFGGLDNRNVLTTEETQNCLKDVRSEFTVADNEIRATVTALETNINGSLSEIRNSIITNDDVAGIISQALIDGKVVTEATISTSIEEGIANATISADKVNIGGDVNINDVLKVDDNIVTISNAEIENCDITKVDIRDVTINGSLRSPFVLDNNSGGVDTVLHDNIVCHLVDSNATQLHTAVTYENALQWDPSQNGRIVRIANGLWKNEGEETTEKSVGLVKLEAPSEKKDFTFRATKGTWSEPETLTNLPSGIGNYIAYSNVRFRDVNESISSWEDRTATLTIPPGVKTYTFYVKKELKRTNSNSGGVEIIADGSGTPLAPTPVLFDVDSYIITTPDGVELEITASSQWKPINITVPNTIDGCTIQITHRRNENSIYNTSTAYIVLPEILLTGYFFENGIATTDLILSREVVELTGFGFENEFYGWIVTNRSDFNPEGKYGRPLKLIAGGRLYYEYDASANKYIPKASCYSPYNRYKDDGVLKGFGVISYEKGKYILVFNDSYSDFKWKDIFDDPGTVIMATGYDRILEDDLSGYGEAPSKACVAPRLKALTTDTTSECGYKIPSSGSGTRDYPGFEVWISDDTTCNYGGFNFMIYNISDIKGQPV